MNVEVLTADTVDGAGALIAREHRHVVDGGVPLPLSQLDAAVCSAGLSELLSDGFSGFVARRGEQTVGVMCGRTFDGVGFVPAHGIAVAPDVRGPTSVMAELFAELAPVLLADGAFRVTIDQVAHQRATVALFDLGFGRGGVFAVRETEPKDVEPAVVPAVEVRVGTGVDLDSIAALSQVEFLHRSMAPMYALGRERSLTQARSVHERLLDEGAVHLLARTTDRDVGLLTIEHTTAAPRLCWAGAPYIGATATIPDARRMGVGRSLLQAALQWARARDHASISVDFDSRNPLSRPFWLGNGFRPTGHRLRRVLVTRPEG